jgi:hypothetical protein
VARIGKVVREQVALYSTLTGTTPAARASQPTPAPDESGPPATVHELSARRARER